LLALAWRRRRTEPPPEAVTGALPPVTVQLPLYNERYVAARVIDAVAALDYPRDRLEIQVLDDSTDDTPAIVAHVVTALRTRGFDVSHVRRRVRTGFKAGALAEGLTRARGEFVAIFDADFVPAPDVLRRLLASFEPDVACVQARWSHLNRAYSTLTRAQAMTLDAHFAVEQAARSRSGLLLQFDGTAGVWRRSAIVDAGGWDGEMLSEDLDLAYRAQLRGWRVLYRADVECPAELPVLATAFKRQQRRWATGFTQATLKHLARVTTATLDPWARLLAVLHLTSWSVHPLALIALMLAPIVMAVPATEPLATFGFVALAVAALGTLAQFAYAQQVLDAPWRRRIAEPLLALVPRPGSRSARRTRSCRR
jgi:cellulose synthase/poly-beta-1,6-N-acetylglucosamine synthase-like glycosyltransferase